MFDGGLSPQAESLTLLYCCTQDSGTAIFGCNSHVLAVTVSGRSATVTRIGNNSDPRPGSFLETTPGKHYQVLGSVMLWVQGRAHDVGFWVGHTIG